MGPNSNDLQKYYDRNTSAFKRIGGGEQTGAIHRKLWGPEVRTASQALQFTNTLIEKALFTKWDHPSPPERILDLGCGIGGTTLSLATQYPALCMGITISRIQAIEAQDRKARARLQGKCEYLQGDYHHIPTGPIWDAAYAIESFVHSADPEAFFQSVSSCLKPNSRLIICDDFLVPQNESATEHRSTETEWINRFRRGWLLGNLLDTSTVDLLAQRFSFQLISDTDLTPLIRIPNHLSLEWLKLISRIPLPGSYWRSVSGGIALTHCHRMGSVQYRLLVFDRFESSSG